MRIVMVGIVGSGKGTQAGRLSSCLSVPHISTGDIFRDAAQKATRLGLQAKRIMKEGGLVPDDIVLGIVNERLKQPDVSSGYILDGFPRTISQAEEFDKIENLDCVFYITIPRNEAIRRLTGRRNCEKCNAQYNTYLDDISDRCPKCAGKIVKREDDNRETIKIRIENYIAQTQPLIDYYREKNILREIDGTKSIDEVFENICEIIGH